MTFKKIDFLLLQSWRVPILIIEESSKWLLLIIRSTLQFFRRTIKPYWGSWDDEELSKVRWYVCLWKMKDSQKHVADKISKIFVLLQISYYFISLFRDLLFSTTFNLWSKTQFREHLDRALFFTKSNTSILRLKLGCHQVH